MTVKMADTFHLLCNNQTYRRVTTGQSQYHCEVLGQHFLWYGSTDHRYDEGYFAQTLA